MFTGSLPGTVQDRKMLKDNFRKGQYKLYPSQEIGTLTEDGITVGVTSQQSNLVKFEGRFIECEMEKVEV